MILRGFRRRKKTIYKDEFIPNTTKCKQGCIYYRSIGAAGGIRACHYFLDTNILRGRVPDEECEKFCNDKKQFLKKLFK